MKDAKFHLKITRWDKIVIGSVSFFSVIGLFFFNGNRLPAETISVYQDRIKVAELSLKEDKTADLPVKNGRMKVMISGGRIKVLESSCPRGLCVHQGWIGEGVQAIVCLPNKTIIEAEGSKETRYDVISH